MEPRNIALTVVVALLSAFVGLVMHGQEADQLEERRLQAKRELARAEEMLTSAESGRLAAARNLSQLRDQTEEWGRQQQKTADEVAAARIELQTLERTLQGLRGEQSSLESRRAAARLQVIAREVGRKYPRVALNGGKVLLDAVVQKVTPTAITFKHSLGLTTATVSELPVELVNKFLIVESAPSGPATPPSALSTDEDPPAPETSAKGESDLITGIKRRSAEIHRLDQRIASVNAEIPRVETQIREAGARRAPNPALLSQLQTRHSNLKSSLEQIQTRRTTLVQMLLSEIESTRSNLLKDSATRERYGQFLDREYHLWEQRLRDSRY